MFPVLSVFVPLSGLPSSSAASNCGRHPLHPYLSGLHPRAAGPAPVGKAGEASQPPSPLFSLLSFLALIPGLAVGLCQSLSYTVMFFKSTGEYICPHRSLQSSCCRTCVPSTPYPSPSVWPGWPLVSWGPSSQVSQLFFLSLHLIHLCLWL